jgi:hypothetical protein
MDVVDGIEMSAIDGGLDASFEYASADPAGEGPGYGENDGLWLWDDEQSIGVHAWLGHSRAEGRECFERMTVFLPDGTLLVNAANGQPCTDASPSGASLIVRCDEPYRRWSYSYRGPARPTSAAELRDGPIPADRAEVDLEVHAEARMLLPPWTQGGFWVSREAWLRTPAASFTGGARFEQLLSGTATVRIAGAPEQRFTGSGLRTHRKGVRSLGSSEDATEAYPGHIWMDAAFPSGRAFYVMWFGGPDGKSLEGGDCFVRDGDVFHRAEVVGPPPFRTTLAGEERFAFELTSDLGVTHIEGELVANSFETLGGRMPDWWGIQWDLAGTSALGMNQGIARYRWDDEVASNMIERSAPIASLSHS